MVFEKFELTHLPILSVCSLKKVQNKKAILKAIRDAELKAAGVVGRLQDSHHILAAHELLLLAYLIVLLRIPPREFSFFRAKIIVLLIALLVQL